MKDGIIEIDSDRAKEFGFTSDKFNEKSYLWKEENRIWISLIISKNKNKGCFKELVKTIRDKNYQIAIPTPIEVMALIVRKYGFKQTFEQIKIGSHIDTCEVWIK